MRASHLFTLLAVFWAGSAGAEEIARSVGPGNGALVADPATNPCPGSTLSFHHDGGFEDGYAWQYNGNIPPYYGAFAEGFAPGEPQIICGIQFCFTSLTGYATPTLDAYVWDSDGENPTAVLSVTIDVVITHPAIWPNVSEHDVAIEETPVGQEFFVGYWGNWPGSLPEWFVAADLDALTGVPRTNIAPGIGYPTGWQNTSIVWSSIVSLGIGAYANPVPIPARGTRWGRIKSLYGRGGG